MVRLAPTPLEAIVAAPGKRKRWAENDVACWSGTLASYRAKQDPLGISGAAGRAHWVGDKDGKSGPSPSRCISAWRSACDGVASGEG